MKKSDIIAAIESKRSTIAYSSWRIGLTHDLAERKEYWRGQGERISSWKDWEADSLSDAQDIEAHFLAKGMKGGTGGDLSPRKTVYVYIFLAR